MTGLSLAVLLTGTSFWVANPSLLWPPGVALGLSVGIAQVGIQLVFFLRITIGPDDINNVLAPAFGILIGILMVAGFEASPTPSLPARDPAGKSL
jgi:cytochrome o ubiquinol oxidase operon protein cyoD